MRWLLAFLCCFAVVPDAPAAELGEARASMDGIHDKLLILLDSSARRRALRVALSTTDGLTQPHLLTWADATAIANGAEDRAMGTRGVA